MRKVRCAIYTRKSSEEGLEQGFNSLDAQYEACAAYIRSQAGEGWQVLPRRYDDGGLSGGTLERPALQQLLADVAGGSVDIIVVYKVDRLTRSLLDFARLVEAFDAANVSFVSVTQSFNTTTSMGRLTLNMLLSFAQFEREVTAERIRDKIAASKARGMWMGGTPPLGYRPDGRSLAVVEEHACLIRDIFARYLTLGNVRLVADQLQAEGIRTPARVRSRTGATYGDRPFSRGQLYAILRNPVYIGRIAHRGRDYPGTHSAIVDPEIWARVQVRLSDNCQGERQGRVARNRLLQGLLHDSQGEPLVTTHAVKGKVRYSYYVSKALHHRESDSTGVRLPAREIELAVTAALAGLLEDPVALVQRAGLGIPAAGLRLLAPRAEQACTAIRAGDHALVRSLLASGIIHEDRIELCLITASLASLLGFEQAGAEPELIHSIPARLSRTGRAIRLVQDNALLTSGTDSEHALLRNIAKGRQWWKMLCETGMDIKTLAAREGVTASWMTRLVRLAFLSPRVVEAAMGGTLRAGTDTIDLFGAGAIPHLWCEQENLLLSDGMEAV
jgi:DNA invertase Pin-like site-specific DNA recombinase